MGLEYLQLWADMEALFEPYDDAQRGRLIMAMMAYAYRGEDPEFTGVEKFIWPVLRQHIDRCTQNIEAKKAAGSKGGKGSKTEKQTQADVNKNKQNEAEVSNAKQEEAEASKQEQNESKSKQNAHTQYHDHDNDHDQYHNHEEVVVVDARARATATATPESVEAFDGSDITEVIEQRREVERLIKRYRLTNNDTTMDALLDDVGRWGMDAVKGALESASLADSRGGLSVKYYRTFLGAKPRAEPFKRTTGASANPSTTNPFAQMLIEEGYGA